MTMRTVLLMMTLLLLTISLRGFQAVDLSPSPAPDFVRITSSPAVWVPPGPTSEVCVGDGDRSHHTTRVFPAKGGEVRFGRYCVVIPPQAIDQSYAVSVCSEEPSGRITCELLPHGLDFTTPATLTIDLSGTDVGEDDDLAVFCWNERIIRWENIGGTYDPLTETITTGLTHFSRYSAQRLPN